jgi:predicted RNase H-like HicB family nuclease
MLDLKYSLIIEATEDPNFFGFYSPQLEGFTGSGNSIEDCLYKAKWGMAEHTALLRERGIPIPTPVSDPSVTIRNSALQSA